MVFYENGKKSKRERPRFKRLYTWIIKHPKVFAFLVAVLVIAILAAYRPDYVESVSKAFVLLIGVGL